MMRSNSELKILNQPGADERTLQEAATPEAVRIAIRNKVVAAVCDMDSFDLNLMLRLATGLTKQKKEAEAAQR